MSCLTSTSVGRAWEVVQVLKEYWEAGYSSKCWTHLQKGQQLGDVMLGRHCVDDAIKGVCNSLHTCCIVSVKPLTLSLTPAC